MRAWVALAILLLLWPPAAPALHEGALHSVGLDLFLPLPPDAMTFEVGCGGGAAFEVLDDGFRFHEVDGDAGGLSVTFPGQPPGYTSSGCGWAAAAVDVPAGLDHMHVRFMADRSVQVFDIPGPLSPQGDGFVQELRIEAADGRGLAATRYFAINEPSREETFHDLPPPDAEPYRVPGGEPARIVFFFDDLGYFLDSDLINPISGEAYESTVRDVEVEFSAVPADTSVVDTTVRRGIQVLDQMRVAVQVDADTLGEYGVNVRAVVQGMRLSHIVLPDGTRFEETGTRRAEGPHGFDAGLVLVERFQGDGIEQVTVPHGITGAAGPGEYVLVFESIDPRVATAPLSVLALVLLAAPLPFAAAAAVSVRRFERVAFGDYRRSARNLLWALLVVMAFYLSVVVSALIAGRLALMATRPLGLEGWLLYVQVVIALLAFVALWSVARRLLLITKPKPLPAHGTPPAPRGGGAAKGRRGRRRRRGG